MENKDYTIDQVAAILQVHRKTVERLINTGKMDAYLIGNVKRITPESLDRYKQEHPARRSKKRGHDEDTLPLAG